MHGQKKIALFLYCAHRTRLRGLFFILKTDSFGWYIFLIKDTDEMEHV